MAELYFFFSLDMNTDQVYGSSVEGAIPERLGKVNCSAAYLRKFVII